MEHRIIKNILMLVLTSFMFTACNYDKEEDLYPFAEVDCDTINVSYSLHIKPLIDNTCVSCHQVNNPSGGVLLDTYDHVKVQAENGRLYGSLNHESGFVAMPLGGSKINSCSLLQVKAWIDNGSPDN